MTPIANHITITPLNLKPGLVNYPCGIAVVDTVSEDIKEETPTPGTKIIYAKGGVTKMEGVFVLNMDYVLAVV